MEPRRKPQKESSTRGTNYAAVCGGHGVCVKVACSSNADCGGNSFCAGGARVVHDLVDLGRAERASVSVSVSAVALATAHKAGDEERQA